MEARGRAKPDEDRGGGIVARLKRAVTHRS
jgi:hypothetical protein